LNTIRTTYADDNSDRLASNWQIDQPDPARNVAKIYLDPTCPDDVIYGAVGHREILVAESTHLTQAAAHGG
jgi:hypothetical protein